MEGRQRRNPSTLFLSLAPPSPLATRGLQTLAAATPSLLLPSSRRRRWAPPRHNPDGPLGWRQRGVSLPMAAAQWSSSAGRAGVHPSVGLVAAVGRSVASPRRLSCSVDSGHLLGASRGVAVPPPLSGADPRPRWPGVAHRGCHRADLANLLHGEARWRVAAPSRRRCVVLASTPCGGPHGGGDGKPWADGVAHPRGEEGGGCSALPGAPPLAPPSVRRLMPAPKL
jgi:hypothetical protein